MPTIEWASVGEPSVAIAMPVRDCEGTIETAIRSILHQSYRHWTLFLMEDGSRDRTRALAETYTADARVKVVADGRSLGITARLNQAISLSGSHEYFARMDGDDISYPERLERQVAMLEGDQRLDVLGSSVLVFGDSGEALGWRRVPSQHAEICSRAGSGFHMAHPTWCGRRQWFERFRYDERAYGCEDQDLLRRSWRSSRFANLPEILLGYREHGIRLGATIRTRKSTVCSVARAEGGWTSAATVRATLEQASKGLAEVVACALHRDQVVLRRRRLTLPLAAQPRWAEVWRLSHL
jgi:glycosyltransferase involved in cell wall biosynthesis